MRNRFQTTKVVGLVLVVTCVLEAAAVADTHFVDVRSAAAAADAFASLEALASALGGVVGCSRAVTNNGWRNHTDQVGQTGTRIAPDVYFACGISGAIQHWVGAMASKQIIAVNTDPEANMVTKADYAVIGDLHEVVPAITEEITRRRS